MKTKSREKTVRTGVANSRQLTSRRQSAGSDWKFAIRALRHRNYALFFSGQTISLIGTWMTRIATSWLVYRLTGSAFLLGLVGFSGQIPMLAAGAVRGRLGGPLEPPSRAGGDADSCRWCSRSALAALALSHRITVVDIILLSVFQGMINAFDMPARQAFVIQMVEHREDLPNAIALNSSMVNASRLIGPSIAGAVIAVSGEGYCFLIDGISYIAVIASLLAMKNFAAQQSGTRRNVLQELAKAGAMLPASCRYVRSAAAGAGIAGRDAVHRADADVRGTRPARRPAYPGIPDGRGRRGRADQRRVAGGAEIRARTGSRDSHAAAMFGSALIAFSFSHWLWLSLLLMVATGFGMMQQMAASNTILQTIVEDDKRGRVMSFYSIAFRE